MRILFLLTQDLESPLGVGRIWPLANELASKGHLVRIAALHSSWEGLVQKHYIRNGVDIKYVAPMHVRKTGIKKHYYSSLGLIGVALRASWALMRAALAKEADLIVVCKPHPMNGLAGLVACRLKGARLVVDCDDYEAEVNRFMAGWQRRVVAYFEQHLPQAAQVVTTNTQFMRDKLVGWGCLPERIYYMSNGVDPVRFTAPDPVAVTALRDKLGLQQKRVVAYLGSLSLTSHSVDLLIEAFKMVHERLSTAALLIVGGGEDVEVLDQLARRLGIDQSVLFTGRVLPAEVPMYYALADITVDPVIDSEAARGRSPLKLFESWIMGVPFVTAPVGERVKLAGEPPACMMTNPAGGAEALAEAILHVLNSPDVAAALRQRGFERVEDYTWDRLAARLEQIYLRLR
jgi:glycosyltransferase involved in cell wall biosynthesis